MSDTTLTAANEDTAEPVAWAGLIAGATTLVTAVIALLVAFGINLDPDQQKAVLGVLAGVVAFVGAVAPIVAALRARAKVTPFAGVIALAQPNGGPIIAGPAHPAITGTVVAIPPPASTTGDVAGA